MSSNDHKPRRQENAPLTLDTEWFVFQGQHAADFITVIDEHSDMRRYVVGDFKIRSKQMKFEDCRNSVAKYYGEEYDSTHTNLGVRAHSDLLAGRILNNFDSSTLAAVFSSRKEGGTIVTKMGQRMGHYKRELTATPFEHPARRELLTARIDELQDAIDECLRS